VDSDLAQTVQTLAEVYAMKKILLLCFWWGCLPLTPLAQPAAAPDTNSEQYQAREQLAYVLGVQAYLYGFPLVRMEQVRQQSLAQSGAAINALLHRRRLQTHQDRVVVSPNNDTVYSSAWLDLANEPLVLHTPDAQGRYCSYALYDAYTNNFQVISKRNARAAATDYVLVGPRWRGVLPKGVTRINAPTDAVWLLVRTLIADESEWPAVRALQAQMKLAPLSQWGKQIATAPLPAATPKTVAPNAAAPLAFFEQLGALLQRNPPPVTEAALLHQFALIGLSAKDGFVPTQLDEATKAGLVRALPAARQIIANLKLEHSLQRVNGWQLATRGGAFGNDYLLRAVVADMGIGQLVPAEACYLTTDVDGDGQPLTGAHRYVLRFAKAALPPAREFWSLSLYGADYFFVANPLNRYALGDRTRGLQYDADGGLTIYLQHDEPSGHAANWLPTPAGAFNLNLRAYLPQPELLRNQYQPPAVRRVP
jgi:hypothetical protein